jgi:hypothetical protein
MAYAYSLKLEKTTSDVVNTNTIKSFTLLLTENGNNVPALTSQNFIITVDGFLTIDSVFYTVTNSIPDKTWTITLTNGLSSTQYLTIQVNNTVAAPSKISNILFIDLAETYGATPPNNTVEYNIGKVSQPGIYNLTLGTVGDTTYDTNAAKTVILSNEPTSKSISLDKPYLVHFTTEDLNARVTLVGVEAGDYEVSIYLQSPV